MKNGDGLRVVLWVAGCGHHCKDCQNPVTWDPDDGIPFGQRDKEELYEELKKDYISGITFSGGDPFYPGNRADVKDLMQSIKHDFPNKTIWVYTGYTWEEVMQDPTMSSMMGYIDVLVDGKFVPKLKDVNYPWAGSTNQKIIDVKNTLEEGRIVLHESR